MIIRNTSPITYDALQKIFDHYSEDMGYDISLFFIDAYYEDIHMARLFRMGNSIEYYFDAVTDKFLTKEEKGLLEDFVNYLIEKD